MKRVAANLALFAAAVVASLAIGEAALRTVVTLPLPRQIPEVKYAPHPIRRFTLVPDQRAFTYGARATIDATGFRTNGEAGRPPQATMFALGDSFTFGLGVNDDQTWPAQLERHVRASNPTASVVNGGTISYGVFQELDLLKATLTSIRPAVVIHGLYWNDYMNPQPPAPTDPDVVTAEGYFVWDQPPTYHTLTERLRAALNRAALFYSLKQIASQAWGRTSTSTYSSAYSRMLGHGIDEEDWKPIDRFYRELQMTGDRHGFTTFVVIMPVNDLVRGRSSAAHPYPTAARQRLSALGIPYLDAFELWDRGGYGNAAFLPQGPDAHLNAEGYRILADALAQKLVAAPTIAQGLQ
jgi:lysophospholipase L1-like esterase